jgi:hypothetical protein
MADLVLVPQDGYAVSGAVTGDDFVLPVTRSMSQGYHGYLASNPKMNAVHRLRTWHQAGCENWHVDNIDVAPTIAHLLGQQSPALRAKLFPRFFRHRRKSR